MVSKKKQTENVEEPAPLGFSVEPAPFEQAQHNSGVSAAVRQSIRDAIANGVSEGRIDVSHLIKTVTNDDGEEVKMEGSVRGVVNVLKNSLGKEYQDFKAGIAHVEGKVFLKYHAGEKIEKE